MFLTIASYAFAAELREDHPSTYVVRKGDTLWDIAGRFLKKPWQWPEIWQANPQIKNPHLIYPGDVISLAYLDGRPYLGTGPGVRTGDPVDAVPLADIQAFLKQMDVLGDEVKTLPHVVGLEEDRLLTSAGQIIYVRGLSAEPGTLVRVVRPTAQYFQVDPAPISLRDGVNPLDYRARPIHKDWEVVWSEATFATDKAGRFLGNEVMQQALGEVTQVRGEITTLVLREENRDVRVGDRILPLEVKPYDATYFPHPPASIPAGSRVLAVADGVRYAGTKTVIALALGRNDGVDNGTVFSIWSPGAIRKDMVTHRERMVAKFDEVTMPDEFAGHVMVFRTFDNVSYGLLMDGIRPVKVNYLLKHPDARQ